MWHIQTGVYDSIRRKNMKIVMINGSPRKEGITGILLKGIQTELTRNGAEVKYYDLSGIRLSHCMGCMACFKTGRCHMERISEEIANADGLVLGSPAYVSNVSGLMKDFIDRGHFVMEQMLHGKHCIVVTTGINYGKNDAEAVLKRLVVYSGGYVSARISENIPYNDRALARERAQKKCIRAASRLLSDISKDRKTTFQHIFHLIVFHIGIKPFVYNNREKYDGVINKWAASGLCSR